MVRVALVLMLAVACWPELAAAEKRSAAPASESVEAQVERLAAEAVNAYRGADYHRAVELLQKAYGIRQVPALLYNMAKAYDKLGDVDHAYENYRRYADSEDADAKLKAKSEARLAAYDEIRRKKAAADKAAEEAGKPATLTPPQPAQPTAEEIAEKLRQERARTRHRDRIVALALGIGTVAFGGVAVGLSVNALSLDRQFNSTTDPDRKRTLKSQAQLQGGVADGFYAGTAVLAGVTAYYVYRAFRPEPKAPSLTLAPSLTPSSVGLAAEVRFR